MWYSEWNTYNKGFCPNKICSALLFWDTQLKQVWVCSKANYLCSGNVKYKPYMDEKLKKKFLSQGKNAVFHNSVCSNMIFCVITFILSLIPRYHHCRGACCLLSRSWLRQHVSPKYCCPPRWCYNPGWRKPRILYMTVKTKTNMNMTILTYSYLFLWLSMDN